jgi:ABC-type glycerol-3-phosphate transport system substrate-binding protein
MLRRQLIFGGTAILGAATMAACGAGGGDTAGGESGAPKGIGQTDTTLVWQEELPTDIEQNLDTGFLADWTQKYPKVKISPVNYGGGDSQTSRRSWRRPLPARRSTSWAS